MRTKITCWVLCAATLVAVLSAIAMARGKSSIQTALNSNRQFWVAGKVLEVNPLAKTIRVAHQEIPGFMPAMAMPFRVQNVSLLKGLNAGDAVEFQLRVTEDDAWIARIDKVAAPTVPAGAQSAIPAAFVASNDSDRLQVGERVPDLTLTDQNGQAVRLSSFQGKAVILTFIYTRCPIPNFCPLMSKNFAALQERLQKHCPDRFHLLSISIDPEFDKPEVLKSYAIRYDANEKDWTFATGTREQVDFAANLLGLVHEPENGFISHDFRTALISPEGKLVHVWKSNVWTPYELERRVHETLGDKSDHLAGN